MVTYTEQVRYRLIVIGLEIGVMLGDEADNSRSVNRT